MKIISKFQDYYDIGIAYGVDEKLRFVRQSTEVKTSLSTKTTAIINYKKASLNYKIILYFELIVFCGTIFPYVRVVHKQIYTRDKKLYTRDEEQDFFYSLESLNIFFVKKYKALNEIKYSQAYYNHGWRSETLEDRIKEFFMGVYTEMLTIFDKYKVPYFSIEQSYIFNENNYMRINYTCKLLPQLKAYKFAKIVPPMQAFQEISMYLGQLDLAEDNTVTIEDKYLAQGKGFNCYSFKKMPTKKKVKRC